MNFNLKPGFGIGGPFEKVISREYLSDLNFVTASSNGANDEFWMHEAFVESLKGVGITNPNPAVGCVIVKAGIEISRGFTQAYRGKHAERVAIEKVENKSLLIGATVYVTLEPCAHQGNQPPCCDLLAESQIARIVVGRRDSDPRVNGEGIRRLEAAGKKVQCGFYENEITAWNLPFFASRKRSRPLIALKWAQTLDGQLADDEGSSHWISGTSSRSYTHWLRQRYDAILVSAKTYLSDQPQLTARDCAEPIQSQPLKLVWDPSRRLQALSASSDAKLSEAVILQSLSVYDLILELRSEKISERLGHSLQSILIEGGAGVITSFLQTGFADVLHTFVSPQITGGQCHRIQPGKLLRDTRKFHLVAQAKLGNDSLMEMISDELVRELREE